MYKHRAIDIYLGSRYKGDRDLDAKFKFQCRLQLYSYLLRLDDNT